MPLRWPPIVLRKPSAHASWTALRFPHRVLWSRDRCLLRSRFTSRSRGRSTSQCRKKALRAYDEVVRRFGESASPALGVKVKDALLRRAEIEIENRQYEKAAETAGLLVERRDRGSPAQRLRGHLIRAKALIGLGDQSACERDVEAVLALPELRSNSGVAGRRSPVAPDYGSGARAWTRAPSGARSR